MGFTVSAYRLTRRYTMRLVSEGEDKYHMIKKPGGKPVIVAVLPAGSGLPTGDAA
jgi:hypothetical protein